MFNVPLETQNAAGCVETYKRDDEGNTVISRRFSNGKSHEFRAGEYGRMISNILKYQEIA